jgi:hypothetical protein
LAGNYSANITRIGELPGYFTRQYASTLGRGSILYLLRPNRRALLEERI